MDAPNADQMPEGWSDGASGYDENFAGFTGLYAEEMLDLLHVGEGSRVLDVAAGSGATSVRAARRGAEVTATDFAEGMVAIAERRLREGGHTSSRAVRMDGQALDLPDGAFDAAVSMFGLMFFPDTAAGVAEMRRVVRPGGRVGTATWDLDAFPMHRLIGAALEVAMPELAGQDRPRPTWAALGTEAGLAALLRDGGLADVEVRRVQRRWLFDDPATFFRGMPSWSSPVKPLFEMLPAERIDAAAGAFADLVEAEGGAAGGPGLPMSALLVSGTVA